MPDSIEDIILDHDRRGVSALRPHSPPDFCDRAGGLILDNPGTATIATGFYILSAGMVETDGPPGAIAIGDALQAIGYEVVYVTDSHAAPLMNSVLGSKARVVDFPIADSDASRRAADDLLDELAPSVVIAIERCGLTGGGLHQNMHGQDISQYTAKLDYLFTEDTPSVGIGDGGNEIGMGKLADVIPTVPSLAEPCVTATTELVISSVSNWGGYGLVAALSKRSGRNLLPSLEYEQDLVRKTADAGAVDGMSAKQEYRVDGFTLEENSRTVQRLHDLLAAEGIGA